MDATRHGLKCSDDQRVRPSFTLPLLSFLLYLVCLGNILSIAVISSIFGMLGNILSLGQAVVEYNSIVVISFYLDLELKQK